jgi:hypothetical protein
MLSIQYACFDLRTFMNYRIQRWLRGFRTRWSRRKGLYYRIIDSIKAIPKESKVLILILSPVYIQRVNNSFSLKIPG